MKEAYLKNLEFYKGKKVLVTGHTGFKGAWLTAVLNYMGADAMGYALAPVENGLYRKIHGDELIHSVIGDLLDADKLKKTVKDFAPEIVLHLAASCIVSECYNDPVRAYSTNLMGSLNVLEAVRECKNAKSVVLISTDKVYENNGDGAVYTENSVLGGQDAYSTSKVCMELMAADHRKNYLLNTERKVGIATARASNVLGGGDHMQTRLVPSILTAVAAGTEVKLRNPAQTRPWQSVLDALNGYLAIARCMYFDPEKYSGAWNIGPTIDGIRTVSWVFEKIQESFNGLERCNGDRFKVAESETLGLDIQKALDNLDWEPRFSCEKTVDQVVDFFKRQQAGEPEAEICLRQISEYYTAER